MGFWDGSNASWRPLQASAFVSRYLSSVKQIVAADGHQPVLVGGAVPKYLLSKHLFPYNSYSDFFELRSDLKVKEAGKLRVLDPSCGEGAFILGAYQYLLDWHLGALAILIPFLIAAVLKTFQGSSLVAAITAAGMVQPLMGALDLGGANAKALAALAVGAGAMTVSHVNDDYFWLSASDLARILDKVVIGVIASGSIASRMIAGLRDACASRNAAGKSAVCWTVTPKPPKARA